MSVELLLAQDAAEVAEIAAAALAEVVQAKPDAVVGFATGGTPLATYRRLTELSMAGELDASNVRPTALDEYLGVPGDDPRSFRAYLRRHVLDPLRVHEDRGVLLDGAAADPIAECERFERGLTALGGVDVQLVGIGRNGHLAFNEPWAAAAGRTHVRALAKTTRDDNAGDFPGDPVPALALTQGLGTILEARTILLVATGDGKAGAVAAALDGPIDLACPASQLQRHPRVRVVLDPEAASGLSRRGRGAGIPSAW